MIVDTNVPLNTILIGNGSRVIAYAGFVDTIELIKGELHDNSRSGNHSDN